MARVAIVTGGTRGIGEAISIALKDMGMKVAANYAGNDERAREFTDRTGIPAYKWDVADFDACQEGVQQGRGRARPGRRAGQQCRHHPRHDDEADGPPEVAGRDRHQPRRLLQHGQGGVRRHAAAAATAGSSTSARSTARPGQYGQVNYAAAKSGIHGFTKALAQEGARNGVTVNAIAPGYIDTDMVAAVPEEVLGKIVAKIPVGRLGKAEEIARGVAFLVDENAGFVTGSTLSINGGQHMY